MKQIFPQPAVISLRQIYKDWENMAQAYASAVSYEKSPIGQIH